MQNSSATATIIGWLDLSIPDQKLHFDLVQVLYRTPKSIFGATIVSLLVMAIATAMSGDSAFEYFFAGFVLVGGARIGTIYLYNCAQHAVEDRAATTRWECAALPNAWAFAGLVGLSGAYAVVRHPGTDVELLINTCVMGYIAGISSTHRLSFHDWTAAERGRGSRRARRLSWRSLCQHYHDLPIGLRQFRFRLSRLSEDRTDRASRHAHRFVEPYGVYRPAREAAFKFA